MTKKKLIEEIPHEFKDSLPVNVFFAKGKNTSPIKRNDLVFVSSHLYNTKKMRCYNFYKPAFI